METVQFKMNLPLDVKQWLEREAQATNRSQSAMVVTVLRAAMRPPITETPPQR